jgi:hypothetical protein
VPHLRYTHGHAFAVCVPALGCREVGVIVQRYEPYRADFGAVNLGVVYRFCDMMDERITDPRLASCREVGFIVRCMLVVVTGEKSGGSLDGVLQVESRQRGRFGGQGQKKWMKKCCITLMCY